MQKFIENTDYKDNLVVDYVYIYILVALNYIVCYYK